MERNLAKALNRPLEVTALNLANSSLRELPAEIGRLTQLRSLNLSGSSLRELPVEIGQLTRLQRLYLSRLELRKLPVEIGYLSDLEVLNLSRTSLQELPAEIGHLTVLRDLFLSGAGLRKLPVEIGQLRNLERLDLSRTLLRELPVELGQLSQLQVLDLSGAGLRELPVEIGELRNLERLDLSELDLPELPFAVGRLTRLRSLCLLGTGLRELPPAIGQLSQLRLLDLRRCSLRDLPAELGKLGQLRRLFLHDNVGLGLPPEVLGKQDRSDPVKPREVLSYYFKLRNEEGGPEPLLEAKVLVVGQGKVGKTSLVKRLVHDHFDPEEKQTPGIKIEPWSIPAGTGHPNRQIQVNFWDFAGQEITHSTHQFFLTKRSLYVLVLDARKGTNESNVHYWLSIIESFGGGSPVLVVTNQIDAGSVLDLNETGVRREYPNVRSFFRTSCETREGIEELKEAITRELSTLPHVFDRVPRSFFRVKRLLEETALTKRMVELDEYEQLCESEGISEKRDRRQLLRFLHDLGSVLHFSDWDSPFGLDEKAILEPGWLTEGVYQILNAPSVKASGGVLRLRDLATILSPQEDYEPSRRRYVVGMMKKFELAYEFAHVPGKFLVAELLDPNEPDLKGAFEETLRFEYHYSVLPSGVIPRFIVRAHEFLPNEPVYWRSGVVLHFDKHRALIRGDTHHNIVAIAVSGPLDERRAALARVRDHFRAIHRTMPKLSVSAMVPVPGTELRVLYQDLIKHREKGKAEIWPPGGDDFVAVDELLFGVDFPRRFALGGPQLRRLAITLQDALKPSDLAPLLRFDLDLDLDRVTAAGGTYPEMVFQLLRHLEREEKLSRFLTALVTQDVAPSLSRLAARLLETPGQGNVNRADPTQEEREG